MIGREVQRREVVPVVFDLRAERHAEAAALEDALDVLQRLRKRVQRSAAGCPAWQRQVERRAAAPSRWPHCLPRRFDQAFRVLLELVDAAPERLLVGWRDRADLLEEIGDASALASEEGDAERLDLLLGLKRRRLNLFLDDLYGLVGRHGCDLSTVMV